MTSWVIPILLKFTSVSCAENSKPTTKKLIYEEYTQIIIKAGFGQIEIRARRPYRLLDYHTYILAKISCEKALILLLSKLIFPQIALVYSQARRQFMLV